MSPTEYGLVVVAGLLAGLSGSMAGLASLFSYPALLYVGLPPVTANVTNTVSMFAITAGTAAGSRPELRGQWRRVGVMALFTGAGGIVGAILLLSLPAETFERVVPWLIALGAVLLLFKERVSAWAASRRPDDAERRGSVPWLPVCLIGVYGGYFGAGAGVLMLALISVSVAEPLPVSNAVKNMATGAANTVAAIAYIVLAPVDWSAVAALAVGSAVGSWTGPALVRRLPERPLRLAIGLAGLGLAVQLWVTAG